MLSLLWDLVPGWLQLAIVWALMGFGICWMLDLAIYLVRQIVQHI